MIDISELLKQMSAFKPQTFALDCGVTFELIALDDELKQWLKIQVQLLSVLMLQQLTA